MQHLGVNALTLSSVSLAPEQDVHLITTDPVKAVRANRTVPLAGSAPSVDVEHTHTAHHGEGGPSVCKVRVTEKKGKLSIRLIPRHEVIKPQKTEVWPTLQGSCHTFHLEPSRLWDEFFYRVIQWSTPGRGTVLPGTECSPLKHWDVYLQASARLLHGECGYRELVGRLENRGG